METYEAIKLAQDFSHQFGQYLRHGLEKGHVSSEVIKPDWTEEDVVHASSVAGCAKKGALKATGLMPDDDWKNYNILRMIQGQSMEEMAWRAMQWWMDILHRAPTAPSMPKQKTIIAYSGVHLHDPLEHTTGNIDILWTASDDESVEHVPFEIKLTTFYYGGLSYMHFVQACMYIRLIRHLRAASCNTAVIFTVYDNKDAEVAWRPWVVQYDEEAKGYRLFNDDGVMVFMNGFPIQDGTVFLPENVLGNMIANQHKYREGFQSGEFDIWVGAPFGNPLESWECGTYKAPVYNKDKSVRKGTGALKINCPAFEYCWPEFYAEVGSSGVPPDDVIVESL